MTKLRTRIAVIVAIALVPTCGWRSGREPRSASAPTASAISSGLTSIDPDFDYGQDIVISDEAIAPRWLLTNPNVTVTWHNESATVLSVAFDHQRVRSDPIPPGGTFTWRSATPVSITYHVVGERTLHGAVQVQG